MVTVQSPYYYGIPVPEAGTLVEILSQAEIEALLASLSSDGSAAEQELDSTTSATAMRETESVSQPEMRSAPKADRGPISYELYDFRRPDKFAKDQLRTLQMVHETFARLFASSMSAYLRTSTHMHLVSVEQIPYEEYMRSLNSSIVNVFSLPPLSGQVLLEMELGVVLSMMDRLLGGTGSMSKTSSSLTEIEQAIVESILTRALSDLRSAWGGFAHFTPKLERIETQSQFVQIVPPGDIVLGVLFEIKIGDLRGAVSLCMPFAVLKPVASKLSAQRWFGASTKKVRGQNAAALVRRLATTSVTCSCRLGTTHMSVQNLLGLRVGDVVTLDRGPSDSADLLIGGNLKFRGKPGVAGKKIAVHVEHVVDDEMARAG